MRKEKRKKILLFSGCYLPGFKGGGPIRSIANMVDTLGDQQDFSIITSDRDIGETAPYSSIVSKKWNKIGKANVIYVSRGLDGVKDISRILKTEKFDAISLNSFFSFQFSIIPLIICNFFLKNTPIIIGPRGEFSKGALSIKSTKKRIFLLAANALGLYRDVVWHASSQFEASDIRRVIGKKAKVRVAINISKPVDDIDLFRRSENAPLKVIFISRISPMKNLIGAIDMARNIGKSVIFDVYGPIEDELYWKQCCISAEKLPNNVIFNYKTALHPTKVTETLVNYDLFFLPTFGENFGHVIAEALSAGLPVLISDRTPWRNLKENSIGWDIPLDQPEKFIECIEECCQKSPEEYENWRKSIRAWAVENIGNAEAIEQNRKLFINFN